MYTRTTLAEYLHYDVITPTLAAILRWDVGVITDSGRTSYDSVIDTAMQELRLTDLGAGLDVAIRVVAERAVWRKALRAGVPLINSSADGASWSREAIYTHIKEQCSFADTEADTYVPSSSGGTMTISPVVYPNDPYDSEMRMGYRRTRGNG